jgi:class 3 adenylate cyclase
VDLVTRVRSLNGTWTGTYPPVSLQGGINSRPGLVGATQLDAPGGAQWTFTASGATSNVATRIAALSRPGGILIGPGTAERSGTRYGLRDAGEHRLKNVSQPVRVFRLDAPGRDGGTRAQMGRPRGE